jgi:hypothetical protein
MKKNITLLLCLLCAAMASASDVSLIVEKLDNQGLVPGSTYRLYAQLPDVQYSLHMVWGTEEHPLNIQSSAPFYQNELGGYSAAFYNPNVAVYSPGLKYDSWITLGHETNEGNGMWDIGIDFSTFNGGSSIQTNNGAWFLLPTDTKCSPTGNRLVLIAQFTTTGRVTGSMNLQGWQGSHEVWKAFGKTFSTDDAYVFGCMSSTASNYNPQATWDNGSCLASSDVALQVSEVGAEKGWEVFPNPIRDGLLNIQFSPELNVASGNARIEMYDMQGKRVYVHQINKGEMLSNNRLVLEHTLAGGTYTLTLYMNDQPSGSRLIVCTQ